MKLADDETTVLVAEAKALAEALGDRDGGRFAPLVAALEEGRFDEETAQRAGHVAAVSLETGRAKAVHGPAGVRALAAVWKRSPQGREAAEALDELNTALSVLRGLPVEDVRVAATAPGAFSLTVSAGEYEARLAVDREGVRLRSINVGGGGVGE
ncbi:MAG TPA: hypothetical protein VKA30_11045 [Actinomycetota bacterium]|nr:hypothetical protein [Actinomycetota bacterium]